MRKALLTLPFFLSTIAFAQSPGAFALTGSMITPRFGHMSILLPKGKVLIAGGKTTCNVGALFPCVPATKAELYDPASGSFTLAGTMATANPRLGAVLSDGRVLFAGNDLTNTIAMVEIYDPSAATFTVSGVSQRISALYSASLLRDGRVPLVGETQYGSDAEFYDPITSTFAPAAIYWPAGLSPIWSPLSVLPDNRVLFDTPAVYSPSSGIFNVVNGPYYNGDPASTTLVNGQVLLTGGSDDVSNLNAAYLFDPATATFLATGSMNMRRAEHTSTMLSDGKVLIAGAAALVAATPKFVWQGSFGAEIYDPAAGSFSFAALMFTARSSHSAALLNNGQVLITGGLASYSAQNAPFTLQGIADAEVHTPAAPPPALALFSLSGDGQGQGAIWHAASGTFASADNPAVAGEVLSMYVSGLVTGGQLPPQVTVGGKLAEVIYFGDAPGYPGYYQVNFRQPDGAVAGLAASVRLSYLGRYSNQVTIGVQ